MFNRKNRWTEENIPDLTGKIAIVTGANSGTGYEATRAMASKGASVIMGCRNLEKAEKAAEKIRAKVPEAKLEIIQLDLSDLSSVRKFAEVFTEKHEKLDMLLNNAGIMMPPYTKTVDGFELQLGTNHMGHFALTGLLLDLLIATEGSRIVTMSSVGHTGGKFDFDDMSLETSYGRASAYGRSKLANLLFAYELQRKLDSAGIKVISNASHPGWASTNLQTAGLGQGWVRLISWSFRFVNFIFAQSAAMGALPMLYGVTSPEAEGGAYYGPRGLGGMRGHPERAVSNDLSHNEEDAQRLWDISEELTGITYEVLNT
ncbi:MAG: SDR family oxidoreductase [Candidatus Heimdallarchaeota archaeon]|nr:SDR family oxidoreductase [Candidatus Heimdallarchaeota archaeon]MCK5049142.1 SDR family oxidoreductase [Candidatus Heimdallarchaeota archaeon]